MRQIGQLESAADAQRFAAHLVTLKINAHAEQESGGWVIWVRDEDHLDEAVEELERFREYPANPRYQGAEQAAESIRREELKRHEQMRKNVVVMRGQWNRPNLQRKPVTTALIIVSVVIFAISFFGMDNGFLYRSLMFCDPANINAKQWLESDWKDTTKGALAEISKGQVWRMVTPIFLHFGIMHILFNMWMMWVLGGQVEQNKGPVRYALLVFVLAVTSNVISAIAPVEWGGWPIGGGMSGVLYGVFGYIWIKTMFDPASGLYVSRMTVIILMVWFFLGVFGVLEGLLGINVGNWAHGVGLVVGIGISYWPIFLRKLTS